MYYWGKERSDKGIWIRGNPLPRRLRDSWEQQGLERGTNHLEVNCESRLLN